MARRALVALPMLLLSVLPGSAAGEPEPIVLELSGAAGDWVVLFGDIPDRPRSLTWYSTFEFNAIGDGTRPIHAFLSPPALITRGDGEASPDLADLAGSASIRVSGTSTLVHSDVRNSAHTLVGQTFEGWAVVAGADAPWTLKVLAARHGVELPRVSVVEGSGLLFATTASAATQPLAQDSHAGSSRAELQTTFAAPGWSHLEYTLAPPNGPLGPTHVARDLALFPNGHVHLEIGSIAWILGLSSRTSAAVGTFADAAGDFTAVYERLGWSLDFSLALVHVPIAPHQFPAGWTLPSYRCANLGSDLEFCSAAFSPTRPQSV